MLAHTDAFSTSSFLDGAGRERSDERRDEKPSRENSEPVAVDHGSCRGPSGLLPEVHYWQHRVECVEPGRELRNLVSGFERPEPLREPPGDDDPLERDDE